MALDKQYLKEEVLNELGASDVDVPLTDSDMEYSIKTTLRLLNKYDPRECQEVITTTPGVSKYLFPKAARRIYRLEPRQNRTAGLYRHIPGINVIPTDVSHIDAGESHIIRQGIHGILREFNTEFDWHQQLEGDKLYIYIHPAPNVSYPFSCTYAIEYERVEDVPPEREDWVRDYILAVSLEKIGRKYQTMGSAIEGQNTNLQLPASELVQEGKERRKQLEDDIQSFTLIKAGPWIG